MFQIAKFLCSSRFDHSRYFFILTMIFNFVYLPQLLAEGRVGDIRLSVLSENIFQQIHGPEWVLFKSMDLPNNNLLRQLTGWEKIPDARGRYFRMKKHGLVIGSAGEESIGQLINDLTRSPRNEFVTSDSGQHKHPIIDGGVHNHTSNASGDHVHTFPLAWTPYGGTSTATPGTANPGMSPNATTHSAGSHSHTINDSAPHSHDMNNAGIHNHTINKGGDEETRPYSIIVNYFIKIKDTPECTLLAEDPQVLTSYIEKFNCFNDQYNRFSSGALTLSEFQLMDFIRMLVRFKNTAVNQLGEAEKDRLDAIIDKYPTYYKFLNN